MSRAQLSIEEAERVIEAAFPRQGVTVEKPTPGRGSFRITKANGEIIGAAFDLRTACQQACRPLLKKEAARILEESEEKKREFVLFMAFLREKYNDEFLAYREAAYAEAEAKAGNPTGPQPDPA
jgi:hypothetical protein